MDPKLFGDCRKTLLSAKCGKQWRPNPHIPKCIPCRECEIENYNLAKEDNFKGWELHHRAEEKLSEAFSDTDIELVKLNLYYYRPPEELIYLTKSEHNRLHRKMFNYMRGRVGELHPKWKGDDALELTKKQRNHDCRSIDRQRQRREFRDQIKAKEPGTCHCGLHCLVEG